MKRYSVSYKIWLERQVRVKLHEEFKQRYGVYQRWFLPAGNDHWLYRQRDWIEELPPKRRMW